jgi:hypothetical protein
LTGHAEEQKLNNFTFWLGIDPTGNIDPFADSVVWGSGAHIYNAYAQVPGVETTAQSETITLFTRGRARYAFRHNDAYWDEAELVAVSEEKESLKGRGAPRIQYERLYVLLPPGATREWACAVVDATWDNHRYTVGGSADDGGIGDLDSRIVLAVNPEEWGGPQVLKEFFSEHYPGVRLRTLTAETPDELRAILKGK